MARNDLLRQLIASPHALPPAAPRPLTVAPQAPLPGNLRFGPTNPSQTTNSPFSGGVTGRVPLNVVHPDTPNFQAPTYSPLGAVGPAHPIISALVASLIGGGTGAAPPPGPPGPGPAQSLSPSPSPGSYPGLADAFRTATAQAGPVSSLPSAFNTATSQAGPVSGLAAALATLAQQGRKIGSGGGSNYTRSY
jgi:hypothetical protein